MGKNIIYLLICLCSFVFCWNATASPVAGKTLGEWTGHHSRLVWVQDQGDGADTFAQGKQLSLYGYDSQDGQGERLLTQGVNNYFKPMLSPNGQQVIYSDRRAREMFVLDWASGEVTKLGSGVAVAVWQDPKPSLFLRRKTVWVYCFSGLQPENKYGTAQPLYRFPLHDPKKKELIWDKTNMAWSNVQLSRDGEVLAGLFPWPYGGVVQTETKAFRRYGRGCWTSLSPDNSKLLWIFDGLHRNVQIHDVKSGNSWKLNINNGPGINGFEVYHPRWSNHPRYFVITGPYENGDGGNRIGGGGDKVEVYVGRLDEKAKRVQDWIKVTNNSRADFYPDLWVEGGENVQLTDTLATVTEAADVLEWPQQRKSLVYVWEDMLAANQLSEDSPIGFYQCNLTLRGRALFARDLTLHTLGGWGETGDAGVRIGKALAASNTASIELFVTPVKQQKATIFSLYSTKDKRLSLVQDGDALMVESSLGNERLQQARWPGFFGAGKPAHLVVLIGDGSVSLFKNGTNLGVKDLAVDFTKGQVTEMVLGDMSGNWAGSLAHIAVYNGPLSGGDIARDSEYCLLKNSKKQAVETLVLDAELLEVTAIPAPDSIGAYRRALVVNSYVVKKVIAGRYDEEKIVVAEWAVLDRNIIKTYGGTGDVERLVLEEFDDHPELEGERQMMDIFEPDLIMYYRLK
ncbi:MAG: hypothetical protein COA36_15495 [Desulfotalea sp.]|nr:MAG: hypothetical protein COA36_15495 [Desulfotalea sp.]